MPLIECPECGREVSSSAAACPECAYPVGTGRARNRVPPPVVSGPSQRPWWKTAIPIIGRLAVGSILMIFSVEDESVAGLIAGLLIGGSAIPAWYRDKFDRLGAGRGAAPRDDRLEDQMAEMENRHREQMAQLEQVHTGQIADLEERMDFTERLLTERRGQAGPS